MTGRGRHRLAASVLAAALSTACGGEVENKDVHPRATDPRHAVAARSESTTRVSPTTVPPTSVARPKVVAWPTVVDRGEDVRAIAASLLDFGRWIEWHDPDPALVEHAYAPGSELARNITRVVADLQRARRHIVEVDDAPDDYLVLSRLENLVSWRLTEHRAHRERVDATGRVLQHVGPAIEHYIVTIIRSRAGSPWRLLVTDRQGPEIEVQL